MEAPKLWVEMCGKGTKEWWLCCQLGVLGGKKYGSKREPQQQAASNSFQNPSPGRLPNIVSKVYVPSAHTHLCLSWEEVGEQKARDPH